jgi:hypothetical protein
MPIEVRRAVILLFFSLIFSPVPAQARESEYDWNGPLVPGRLVEVTGLYGDIVVLSTLTPELRLHARRHGQRDNPEDIKILLDGSGDRLRICTIRPGHDGACDPVPGFENVLDRDTEVDLRIHLPVGSPLIARTTYGDLDLRGITGEVDAFTSQGSCRIETSRGGTVETTNGDIQLVLGRMLPDQELVVRSVNGKIRLEVPKDFDAEVIARTENGRVIAEGARGANGGVPRSGRWAFGEPRGRILLETENGDIELRRR